MENENKNNSDSDSIRYRKVFTFSRATHDSFNVPYVFQTQIEQSAKVPAGSETNKTGNIERKIFNSAYSSLKTSDTEPIKENQINDLKKDSQETPDTNIKPSSDSPQFNMPASGSSYPKAYISALKEKVSYIAGFQTKVATIANQLKDLMNKTAKSGSSQGSTKDKRNTE